MQIQTAEDAAFVNTPYTTTTSGTRLCYQAQTGDYDEYRDSPLGGPSLVVLSPSLRLA